MSQNILVVEDDEFLRGLIGHKLLSEGFSFFVAKDGREGLDKIKETKPDLILLDMLLPVMDGFEVLEEIKKDPEIASIPVIALSNLSSKEDIDRALQAGAIQYLIKSQSNPGVIIDTIREVLKKK